MVPLTIGAGCRSAVELGSHQCFILGQNMKLRRVRPAAIVQDLPPHPARVPDRSISGPSAPGASPTALGLRLVEAPAWQARIGDRVGGLGPGCSLHRPPDVPDDGTVELAQTHGRETRPTAGQGAPVGRRPCAPEGGGPIQQPDSRSGQGRRPAPLRSLRHTSRTRPCPADCPRSSRRLPPATCPVPRGGWDVLALCGRSRGGR